VRSMNKKLANPSISRRAEIRGRDEQEKRVHPQSASQLAQQFCSDMIDTLRHNVGEQKKRFGQKF
jgi:hypothetical protein